MSKIDKQLLPLQLLRFMFVQMRAILADFLAYNTCPFVSAESHLRSCGLAALIYRQISKCASRCNQIRQQNLTCRSEIRFFGPCSVSLFHCRGSRSPFKRQRTSENECLLETCEDVIFDNESKIFPRGFNGRKHVLPESRKIDEVIRIYENRRIGKRNIEM